MLASPLAVKRLTLPDADVVLSVELMGVGLKHPGHLHLFFGSYSGFRDLALPPAQGLRVVIRALKSRLARLLEKRTQHKLGAVANSIWLRDELSARKIPVRDDVLPPPTDCSRFSPGDKFAARTALGLPLDKRLILIAGRWEYAKGADRIAQIYSVMPKDWHLLIVTPSGFTYTPLVGPQVTTLTDLQTDQMINAYRAADVLLQPSRFEGYSLVVSEAQACGCPVLTSQVGQAAHLLSADDQLVRSAVIPSPDDANCWLNALADVLASDFIQVTYAHAHRDYALRNVSYPAVQAAWQKFLSKEFETYSWLPR
jgi:glycosyltransferase involved in cell wall biosynthesis